jgi:hypothetical protein
MLAILAVLYFSGTTSFAVVSARGLPHVKYTDFCFVQVPTIDILSYWSVTLPHVLVVLQFQLLHSIPYVIIPFTLLGLTLFKYLSAVRSGWGRTPLFTLLIRDGVGAFFVVACRLFHLPQSIR